MKKLFYLAVLAITMIIPQNVMADYQLLETVDFEDSDTYSEGWEISTENITASQQERSDGTYYLRLAIESLLTGGTINYDLPNTTFTTADEWKLNLDLAFSASYIGGTSDHYFLDTDSNVIAYVETEASASVATIYTADGTSLGTIDIDATRGYEVETFYTFTLIGSTEAGNVTISVADADGTEVIETSTVLDSFANLTSFYLSYAKYWTAEGIDEIEMYVEEGSEEETEESSSSRSWDFTSWSDETLANLAAEAEIYNAYYDSVGTTYTGTLWRSYEKEATYADYDGFYFYGTEITSEEGEEITANGEVIAELAGLYFTKVGASNFAIAVDYDSTSLGTYNGGAYLWLGGASSKSTNNSFIIPDVAAGSTITIGIESHKNSDGRGVILTIDDETVLDLSSTKTYTESSVTLETTETKDVVVYNTNGCHLYFITVEEPASEDDTTTGISTVNANAATDATINVYNLTGVKVMSTTDAADINNLSKGLYIINGKKVVIK